MLHPRICRRVVERILGRPIGKIRILEAEKTAKEAYLAKGIRMDVYHTHYDIEMQTTQQAAISKRAWYDQSAMDMESLHPNETYPDRKDGCVIFICQTTHLTEILHAIQGRRGVWKRPISCRMMVRRRSFCTPLGIPVANPRRWSGFSSTCRILPTPQGIPCWRRSAGLCSMRSRVHGRRGLPYVLTLVQRHIWEDEAKGLAKGEARHRIRLAMRKLLENRYASEVAEEGPQHQEGHGSAAHHLCR